MSGSAADSDQLTTLKKLKKKPFYPMRQQVKRGYRKSDSLLVDTSVMIIP